jgi:hypothetical protein
MSGSLGATTTLDGTPLGVETSFSFQSVFDPTTGVQ